MIRVTIKVERDAHRNERVEQISRVLMQLSWLMHKQFARCVQDHDLTLPQFFALGFLAKADQRCSMNRLAEATQQDAATMTGIVDRLERLGLVERRRSVRDRRVVLVQPTPAGMALLEDVKTSRDAMIREFFAEFDDAEIAVLESLLKRLVDVIEHSPEVSGSFA
ncbi:MAG TPA: MarR family transcriptional regulator [Ardenticatenaceae bacterium]|nr:MarR family transcriptional regulator [Ardenticatenaceae bacterium]